MDIIKHIKVTSKIRLSILLFLSILFNVSLFSQYYTSDSNITLSAYTDNQSCPGTPTVEYEGQTYNTVLIGQKCWMKENLNIGTSINGNQYQTDNGTIEKYCYDNNEDNCDTYGGLYQWNEMMQYTTTQGVQGICPDGWYIPTDEEIKTLEGTVDSQYGIGDPEWDIYGSYRGYDAGKNLKSTSGWFNNGNGSDSSGFKALPGGYRNVDLYFYQIENNGKWWSSTHYNEVYAWYRSLGYGSDKIKRYYNNKGVGYSARCIKDTTFISQLDAGFIADSLSGPVPHTVQFTDTSSGNPTSWEWDFQNDGVIDSYLQNPSYTYNDVGVYSVYLKVSDGSSSDSIIKTNYIHALPSSFTCGDSILDDRDYKYYQTVEIGDQCWMKENLNIGLRIDGSAEQSDNSIIEKYCYDDDDLNCDEYGGLYQWGELMQYDNDTATQGICPSGWHIPTDNDWKILEGTVDSQYPVGDPEWDIDQEYRGFDAGKNLKNSNGWNFDGNGTNSSGFSALPGGRRDGAGSFVSLGDIGRYWTSNEFLTAAWTRQLHYDYDDVWRSINPNNKGLSARCLKDSEISAGFEADTLSGPLPHNVQFTDTTSGNPTTWEWDFQNDGVIDSYLQNPSFTYNIAGSYTVQLIVSDGQTSDTALKENYIQVYQPCPGIPTVEYGDQTYKTVLIDDKCWMNENLNIGLQIDGSEEQTDNSVIEKYCYDNDNLNCIEYGGLYHWNELMQYSTDTGTQGICPEGWHIPTDNEWTVLTNYLGGDSVASGKMKEIGTTHWNTPNTGATNESGFTALPGGYKGSNFSMKSNGGYFWTSSNDNGWGAWNRDLHHDDIEVDRTYYSPNQGFSARCVKDTLIISVEAAFTADSLSGPVPHNVQFTDTSSGNATSWEWDFDDDGEIDSYLQNPTYTYNNSGSYTVKLVVSDDQTSDSTTKENYIQVYQPCPGTPTVEHFGQTYKTVLIDDHCWMKENLNVGTRINGTLNQSDNSIIEKYCYDNDDLNCNEYGGLYQWDELMQYTTDTFAQGICPEGWHVPYNSDWTSLVNFLGGKFVAGGSMKETGYIYWNEPNKGATNSSGFSARGNGGRQLSGQYDYYKSRAFYWSSVQSGDNNAYNRQIDYSDDDVMEGNDVKDLGYSARCVKDTVGTAYNIQTESSPPEGGATSGGGIYLDGTEITVTAATNASYSFINWTENSNVVSTNSNYTFIVIADRNLTANFVIQQFNISLSSDPALGGGTNGDGIFDYGTEVTVSATPNIDWFFVNWTENEDIVSSDKDYSFIITSDRNLVAHFSQEELFSVITNPNPPQGGITSGNGSFHLNDQVTVSASANTGWDFINWTENSIEVSNNFEYSFNISANRNLTANFEQQEFSIILDANPTEGGSVSGEGQYLYGIEATIQATPNPSWNFINWTENTTIISVDQDYTFVVTGHRSLLANFSQDILYSVITQSEPENAGTTTGDSAYGENSNVIVSAIPNDGWNFEKWTEDEQVVSINANYEFSIVGNRNLIAHFTVLEPLSLSINVSSDEACSEDTVYLDANVSGGTENYTYLWYSNPPSFVSSSWQTYDTPTENIWYILNVDDSKEQIRDSVYVSVNPKPLAHLIPKGTPHYVLICPDSGYIYQWMFNEQPIPGATNQFYYPGEPGLSIGDYTVIVTNEWNCSEQSVPYSFTNKSLEIYPNPSSGKLTIEFGFEKNEYPINFLMTDIFGNKVLRESIQNPPPGGKFKYKIPEIKPGIYIIHVISSDNSVVSKKIVVL